MDPQGVTVEEYIEVPIESVQLLEQVGTQKRRRIRGLAHRAGQVTDNSRLYPIEVMRKAVEAAQARIKAGRFLGSTDHPEMWRANGGELMRTAIRWTALTLEGSDVLAEGEILDTEAGRTLLTLLESGVNVGLSIRGGGPWTFEEVNGQFLEVARDGYILRGIDAVGWASQDVAKITRLEHKGGNGMDLTQLKKQFPELVKELEAEVKAAVEASIRTSVKAEVEKEFNTRVESAVGDARKGLEEEIRKNVLESDEVKPFRAFVESVMAAAKPFLPPANEEAAKLQGDLRTAQESLKAKDADLEKAVKERDEMKARLESLELQKQIAAKVEEKIKDHPHAAALRKVLLESKTVEEIDSRFEQVSSLINEVGQVQPNPAGTGVASEALGGTAGDLTEDQRRQRRLAGLPEVPEVPAK